MTINSNDELTKEHKADENSKRNDYLNRMKKHQQDQEAFIRAVIFMFIIFICVICAIFIGPVFLLFRSPIVFLYRYYLYII